MKENQGWPGADQGVGQRVGPEPRLKPRIPSSVSPAHFKTVHLPTSAARQHWPQGHMHAKDLLSKLTQHMIQRGKCRMSALVGTKKLVARATLPTN